MKKATVTIPYDEEKLAALRIYMQRKGTDLDSELLAQLERLYVRFVPAGVQEYLKGRYQEREK